MYLFHLKVTNMCQVVLHLNLYILNEECFIKIYTKFQRPFERFSHLFNLHFIQFNVALPPIFFLSIFPFFHEIVDQLTSVQQLSTANSIQA